MTLGAPGNRRQQAPASEAAASALARQHDRHDLDTPSAALGAIARSVARRLRMWASEERSARRPGSARQQQAAHMPPRGRLRQCVALDAPRRRLVEMFRRDGGEEATRLQMRDHLTLYGSGWAAVGDGVPMHAHRGCAGRRPIGCPAMILMDSTPHPAGHIAHSQGGMHLRRRLGLQPARRRRDATRMQYDASVRPIFGFGAVEAAEPGVGRSTILLHRRKLRRKWARALSARWWCYHLWGRLPWRRGGGDCTELWRRGRRCQYGWCTHAIIRGSRDAGPRSMRARHRGRCGRRRALLWRRAGRRLARSNLSHRFHLLRWLGWWRGWRRRGLWRSLRCWLRSSVCIMETAASDAPGGALRRSLPRDG